MEGTVFKIICFIKHVWETWNYTVGAFVATSYFLSRIPDLCLRAAPLYLSPNRILGPLVYIWKLSHLDSAYPLSFRWLKIVHFAMPWLKTKTAWDSEGFWPSAGAQASYWGCRVGVGVKFSSSSLHCECPVTPPHHHTSHLGVPKHNPLSLKVLEVKVHDHGNHTVLLSTMTDSFSVSWILGTPALHLSFGVFSVSLILLYYSYKDRWRWIWILPEWSRVTLSWVLRVCLFIFLLCVWK